MANYLLSVAAHEDYHKEIISDFHWAKRRLKRDPENSERRVKVRLFGASKFERFVASFDRLNEHHDNRIVIFTSGLLNHDLSAKTFPLNVLEVANDVAGDQVSTVVLGNADMGIHNSSHVHFSDIYGLMHRAIFERQELGRKIFMEADTAKETVVQHLLHEFYPNAAPLIREDYRYLPRDARIPTSLKPLSARGMQSSSPLTEL